MVQKKTVVVHKLPMCDLCGRNGVKEPAVYDTKTTFGPWANLCEAHFQRYGYPLSTNLSKRLVRPIKPDCAHNENPDLWENERWDLDGKIVKCSVCGDTKTVEIDSEIGGRLEWV